MPNHRLSILPTHHRAEGCSNVYASAPPSAPPFADLSNSVPRNTLATQQMFCNSRIVSSNKSISQTTSEGSEQPSLADNDPIPPAGYPKLAVQMGLMPEAAIFRRFGFLNAQNLLYMQAELVSMEERLRKIQVKDDAAPGSKSRYARNWYKLSESADDGDDEQWQLVLDIRAKLKDYTGAPIRVPTHPPPAICSDTHRCFLPFFREARVMTQNTDKALLQQMKIVSAEPPGAYDLRYIQRYLVSQEMEYGSLSGKDSDLWGSVKAPDERAPDLIGLLPRHKEDFFSQWVTENAVDRLLELNKQRKPSSASTARTNKLTGISDDVLLRCTYIMASMLASALPILSIAILYCVQSLKVRIGLIAIFNLLLSFSLAAFTSARRIDVFAVSAAFSAVQVVFVQVSTA